ncbi:MAG: Uma2 family endonuclease [Thioploca sp.]|nr:Uma2 family endonuclease [Thioploca sp.]
MALSNKKHLISEQEYLSGELVSEVKHEYINGHVYAMAGAGVNHNRITMNLVRQFGNHLANTPCEPFSSDMKLKVKNDFFYPDFMVVCENPNEYYTESAIIIVEVLSKSTRKTDQTLKRLAYQSLPSLKEYVLIEPDFVDVEVCRRENHWQSEHSFLGDEVYFATIDLHLSVEAIYARVNNEDMQEWTEKKIENGEVGKLNAI